ncbi:MAG: pyridoxal-phosphate dependent enzyme, partial [Terrimesophilobacter sp.]
MPWYSNPAAREFNTDEEVEGVSAFHHTFPRYAPTPLTSSQALADELQVKRVYIKDESARFGLPSFKILGASWAVFQTLSTNLSGTRPRTLAELKQRLAEGPSVRLVAATDGNHGRAVAHMANLLGLEAAIFVPRGVSAAAVAGIESEYATVTRVDATYDQTVQRAIHAAAEPGSMMIQDTAWPGYHEVPELIVEGYSTLYAEIDAQLGTANPPAVVVTPVGVGSLIQASIAHYRTR